MRKLLFTLSFLLILSGLAAQTTYFSGDLSTTWGAAAPGTAGAGSLTSGQTSLKGSLEVYQDDGTAFVEGTAGYDVLTDRLSFEVSEAYIDYSSSSWGIRIGAQKAVWGKADGMDITNSVFPSDSTALMSDGSGLAINAVRLSFSGSSFTIDGYWIPFFRGSRLPLEEGNPMRDAIIPESITVNVAGSDLVLPVNTGTLTAPEKSLRNGEFGVKASAYLSFCDVSVYGFYGWDKTPLLSCKVNTSLNQLLGIHMPESITINGEYARVAMLGIDAAVPIGGTVLRIENAYFPDRAFQASESSILSGGDIYVRQHQVMGLAGLDWMPYGWTITAQYYYELVINPSDRLQRENAFTHGATLSISRTLLDDALELSLSGMIGLNDFDSAINLQAQYSMDDQLKISAGGIAFLPGPEKDGTYGAFKDLSSIFVKCRYSF